MQYQVNLVQQQDSGSENLHYNKVQALFVRNPTMNVGIAAATHSQSKRVNSRGRSAKTHPTQRLSARNYLACSKFRGAEHGYIEVASNMHS